jgi:hypothetical protein
MKKQGVLILGVLLACGLAFIGCDNGIIDNETEIPVPKSLTIEGIETSLDGIVVGLFDRGNFFAAGYGNKAGVESGTVTIQLKNKTAQNGYGQTDWTGSGAYYLWAWESSDGNYTGPSDWYTASKVNIQTGKTTINWALFSDYTEPKSLTITGTITSDDLNGTNGAWIGLFEEFEEGTFPQMTAIGYGQISESSLPLVVLTVPDNNTYVNSSNPWREDGDYYVAIFPVKNNVIQGDDGFVFTNGGNDPVKQTFNATTTSLAFGDFKKYSELQE